MPYSGATDPTVTGLVPGCPSYKKRATVSNEVGMIRPWLVTLTTYSSKMSSECFQKTYARCSLY